MGETDLGALTEELDAAQVEARKAAAELASATAGVQALETEVGGLLDSLLGPSEAAQASFQELSATWTSLEKAGVPTDPKFKYLHPMYDAWVPFRDAWKSGNADQEALRAMLADGRTAVSNVTKTDPTWKDKLTPPKDISFEDVPSDCHGRRQSRRRRGDDGAGREQGRPPGGEGGR